MSDKLGAKNKPALDELRSLGHKRYEPSSPRLALARREMAKPVEQAGCIWPLNVELSVDICRHIFNLWNQYTRNVEDPHFVRTNVVPMIAILHAELHSIASFGFGDDHRVVPGRIDGLADLHHEPTISTRQPIGGCDERSQCGTHDDLTTRDD